MMTTPKLSEPGVERRKEPVNRSGIIQNNGTKLPGEYLAMVCGVFTRNFETALEKVRYLQAGPKFTAFGRIFGDEIVLSVSLGFDSQLAATTVHSSCDFDPRASAPTAQDLLGECVDAIGAIFSQLLDSTVAGRLEKLVDHSLSSLEAIPFVWTEFTLNKRAVYIKVDKSNLELEKMADELLDKNNR